MPRQDEPDRLSADDARILGLESAAITGHTLKLNVLEPGSAPLDVDALRAAVEKRLPGQPRATQRVDKCHVSIGAGGISMGPLALRYVWPSELDLMARLAGLRLRERHGGWAGEPFDGRSLRHVSVYQRG